MVQTAATGFFGKLPSRGDFVSRRLPSQFVDVWDSWLQQSLASSQAQLGADWLEIYLTSPVWCFALSPHVCGEAGYVGVMIPSVDRVGRYFPLVAAMPRDAELILGSVHALRSWYADTQTVLLEALDEPPLAFESFDHMLADAGIVPADSAATRQLSGADVLQRLEAPGRTRQWHFSASPEPDLVASCADVLASDQRHTLDTWAIWWTSGSELVDPCVLLAPGLPQPDSFAAMLDGAWAERGWTAVQPGGATAGGRLHVRSAAFTDRGKQRSINEDSFACGDAAETWLVADGLGGHESGDVASRMVASVIDRLLPQTSLEQRVERISESLAVVNACLLALKGRGPRGELVASTSAALVLDGSQAACVWAGDSRIYRFRSGQLEQLTTDHSGANADGVPESEDVPRDHTITRAVGGDETLELEVRLDDVQPGDRFLLCTDGVYDELSRDDLVDVLSLEQPEAVCDELKARVLRGTAPDNLTAVIVDILSEMERVPDILKNADERTPAPGADGTIHDTVPGGGSWLD